MLNGTFYLLHEFPIYYLFILFFYINFSFTLQLLTIFVDISEVFFCSWWKNTNSAIDVAASHSAISAMNTITTVRDFTFVFCFFTLFPIWAMLSFIPLPLHAVTISDLNPFP